MPGIGRLNRWQAAPAALATYVIAAATASDRDDIPEDLHAHPELLQQAAIHLYTSKTRAALDRRGAADAAAATPGT